MIKYFLILSFLFFTDIFSQVSDTLDTIDISKPDSIQKIGIKDSLFVGDSLKKIDILFEADSIAPIQESLINGNSHIIDKRTFLFDNYRSTGDFLRSYPLNFIKDLAFMGQPNETFLYGAGFGGISFLKDGILINNRYFNKFDLNYVQSEDIDSVEIIPSPRGFLFGPINNPASVNFIMRDFISPEPYTRIRYYEGPDGEAMIDGKFNAQIYRRWNFSFQITNRGVDDRYTNSTFSIWQTNVKLKYFLSNSINILATYNSVDAKLGLNGGVDVESITASDIISVLYDNQLAQVLFPQRVQDVLNHNFKLKIMTLPIDGGNLELSTYYHYSEEEIKNDLDSVVVKNKYENKNPGAMLRYDQQIGMLSAKLIINYDKNQLVSTYDSSSHQSRDIDFSYLSAAGILSANFLSGKIIPSIFYKYNHQNYAASGKSFSNSNSGLGLDLTVKPVDYLSLYAGYSFYDQFDLLDEKSFEAGAKYFSNNFLFYFKYFHRQNFIPYMVSNPYWNRNDALITEKAIKGVGANLNYNFWKLLIETNFSYYFDAMGYYLYKLPDIQFIGGIYLKYKFFTDNLDLKAGVIFYYIGKASALNLEKIDPSQKIDISVAGEIKKVAIVYFIWENILDEQYFIAPYYPMPNRNIRFGLSWELFN